MPTCNFLFLFCIEKFNDLNYMLLPSIVNFARLSGYYCMANATEYLSTPCPMGHYCPNGTTRADEFKCPVGTFNPALTQTNITACFDCTGGMYCQTQGLAGPTGNCSAG